MKASTRRNVSYVVEASDEERAHRLGVNSLAIDPNATLDLEGNSTVGGILYSAGRDGVVASWDLHMDLSLQTTATNRHVEAEHQAQSEAILSTERRNGETNRERCQSSRSKTTCRLFSQMHTDWVNDIVLCKNGNFDDKSELINLLKAANLLVVSASSDRTVKIWSVREPPYNAHTIGWHKDYVKCLAAASDAGWVASGGFDKRINIWDIERAKASLTINAESTSMHEITENSLGHSHSAASKASLYAMACNPFGSLLATGSPEKVVRLWDPRAGKQVGRLTGHTDNIRALLVSHDGTHVLSGSSDSTIKMWSVKAQRCLNTFETHPDSVWSLYSDDPELRTFYAGSRDGLVTKTELSGHSLEEIGDDSECIGLFKEKSGVVKIVAYEDKYIWTATSSSSINRWLSIPNKESRQVLMRSEYNPEIPASAMAKLPPSKAAYHPHLMDAFLPGESLTLYSGSVMSIPISYQEDDTGSTESVEPLRTVPDGTIKGKPGISSHLVLHNRRHVLAQDTLGEISLWDVVKCKQIKKFGKQKLEELAQEMNGIESFPSWCTIDTRIGAITVQLDGYTCFDCEMYADEVDLPPDYPIREDQRINLGKWVLAHLFAEFVSASVIEEKAHEKPAERSSSVEQGGSQTPKLLHTGKPTETNIAQPPLSVVTDRSAFNSTSQPINSPTIYNGPFTAPPTSFQQPDYFSGNHHYDSRESQVAAPPPVALPNSPLTPTSTTFIKKLKHLSVKAKGSKPASDVQSSSEAEKLPEAKQGVESARNSFDSKSDTNSTKKKQSSTDNASKLTPPHLSDFPPLDIPPFTTVIITEESVEASTGMDLYRGTVSSLGQDAQVIAEVAPNWLLAYLYYNKTPAKEAVKITFALRPYPGSSLPELPGGQNNRLLANRVLRVRKLIQYVADKLDIDTSQALNQVELLCGDTVLSHTMTLAAIKHHIMKSGGDVILSYRLKREGSCK